jgi:hypothetical protein
MSIQPRGGKRGDLFMLHFTFNAVGNGINYFVIGASTTPNSTTESDVDITNDMAFTIRRLRFLTTANAATGNTIAAFRVDGATVISLTKATTVVSDTASAVVQLHVPAGALINFMLDVTDGAANTVSGAAYLICERQVA